jgi:hypothetical protein
MIFVEPEDVIGEGFDLGGGRFGSELVACDVPEGVFGFDRVGGSVAGLFVRLVGGRACLGWDAELPAGPHPVAVGEASAVRLLPFVVRLGDLFVESAVTEKALGDAPEGVAGPYCVVPVRPGNNLLHVGLAPDGIAASLLNVGCRGGITR